MRLRRGEGERLGKGLETFPPRSPLAAPPRVAAGPTRGQTPQRCQPARRGWHGLAAGSGARRVPIPIERLLQLQPEHPAAPEACNCPEISVVIKSGTRQGSPCSGRAVTPREQHLPRERSLLQKDLPDGERRDMRHPHVPCCVSPSAQIGSCTQETPGSPKFANVKPKRLWVRKKKKKSHNRAVFAFTF